MKLVESLESLINNIFNNINEDREHNFEKLLALATDPGFIKKLGQYCIIYFFNYSLKKIILVETYRDKEILQWLSNNTLTGKEVSACLRILLHLLKKHYVKEIEPKIIKNTIQLLKSNSSSVAPSELQSSLAVLCQVLYLKGLQSNKEMVIKHKIIINRLKSNKLILDNFRTGDPRPYSIYMESRSYSFTIKHNDAYECDC